MLRLCLVFWKSEPQYAYKRYAYKKNNMYILLFSMMVNAYFVAAMIYHHSKHMDSHAWVN